MQKKSEEIQAYELINSIFRRITFSLADLSKRYKVSEYFIKEMANSIEDIYYSVIDKLEARFKTGVMYDLENYEQFSHSDPAIDGLLKAINFKPRIKRHG